MRLPPDAHERLWEGTDDGDAQAPSGRTLRILALSGGGAGGAFGAGALAGLSQGGARPSFDVVTGVSTGALIAPFAFVGESWDDRLADAYTGEYTSELLAWSGVRPGASLYPAERLENLVQRYADLALLNAVAAAHAQGRRLFVASANLDAQTTSIWDLGAIAAVGGEAALRLFKDVLVASASLPGVFPPKMITVAADGERFEEMHVDGGAVSPLFVPRGLLRPRRPPAGATEIYALVNTTLTPTVRTTPVGAVPVLIRSFELMLRSSYCNAVDATAAFCDLNGYAFRSASVPVELSGFNMLRFDRRTLRRMFDLGVALGASGALWTAHTIPDAAAARPAAI